MFIEKNKKKIIIIGILCLLVIGGILYFTNKKSPIPVNKVDNKEYVIIELQGEVKYPGKYEIIYNTRLDKVIDIAGGLTSKADQDRINLMQLITGNITIIINESSKILNEDNKKISINTATVTELRSLSGIGESKANSIVRYRLENGPFTSVYDLTKVTGISTTILTNIINDICL